METLPWLLTLIAIGFWLGLVLEHLRSPPEFPPGWSMTARRAGWLGLALASLGGGAWGPQLWSRTTTDFPREPPGGAATEPETRESVLRTPFAVRARTQVLDGEGRPVRSEGTLSLQLPVLLLAYFGGVGWLRLREGRSRSEGVVPTVEGPGSDPDP